MFDDLKDKINDFASSVKSKLPGSKSDDDDEEYEDEEGEFDEKTEEIDVKDKLSDSESEEDEEEFEEDDEEDDESEDDEDAAKAKKQKIMRLGLVGLVLILGASILMDDGGEDENVLPEVKPVVRKNRPKRKKKVVKAAKENPAEVAKKVENKPVDPAPAEVVEAKVEEKKEEVESNETNVQVVENELKLKDDSPEEGPDTVDSLGKEGFEDSSQEESTPSSLGEDNLGQANQGSMKDASEMSEAIDSLNNSEAPTMIEKVVKEKLEYQEPPSYQETGRGLVYNCSGKHWACVDQNSYIECKKNSDWSKENGKDPECSPSNVYRSFKDCRTIQIYNINTITETDFCKK